MAIDFYCEQVLSGKTQVDIVMETEGVLAFHHTQPTWDIHIVIIPKVHIRILTDADPTLLAELLGVAQAIIGQRGFNDANYKLITNGGTYQGTEHLHFHLVSGGPRDSRNPDQQGELRV
jgi:histidine triad (HIT) family protein